VSLLGRLQDIDNGKLKLSPDNLATADAHEVGFIKSADEYIAKTGIVAPEESLPRLRDGFSTTSLAAGAVTVRFFPSGSASRRNAAWRSSLSEVKG
jgi:hypothetical protein